MLKHIVAVLVVIAFAYAEFELVCPGFGFVRPQEPCHDTCSPDHDTCRGNTKCCYSPISPCGYKCRRAKLNITKPGLCPSQDAEIDDPLWGICDLNGCDVDRDCKCRKKCCRNLCGSNICISPVH